MPDRDWQALTIDRILRPVISRLHTDPIGEVLANPWDPPDSHKEGRSSYGRANRSGAGRY